MSKMPIAIDVDLVVYDSGSEWMSWLARVYGKAPNIIGVHGEGPVEELKYNLTKYFPTPPCDNSVKPFDFWEDPYLYDKLKPIAGCVEAVKRMHEAGHPIYFVSHCKKGHYSSKVRSLKRDFPFLDLEVGKDGFYATKNKGGVRAGALIDDRNSFLNQTAEDVLRIRFKTVYDQDAELSQPLDMDSNDWSEIADFVIDML